MDGEAKASHQGARPWLSERHFVSRLPRYQSNAIASSSLLPIFADVLAFALPAESLLISGMESGGGSGLHETVAVAITLFDRQPWIVATRSRVLASGTERAIDQM